MWVGTSSWCDSGATAAWSCGWFVMCFLVCLGHDALIGGEKNVWVPTLILWYWSSWKGWVATWSWTILFFIFSLELLKTKIDCGTMWHKKTELPPQWLQKRGRKVLSSSVNLCYHCCELYSKARSELPAHQHQAPVDWGSGWTAEQGP